MDILLIYRWETAYMQWGRRSVIRQLVVWVSNRKYETQTQPNIHELRDTIHKKGGERQDTGGIVVEMRLNFKLNMTNKHNLMQQHPSADNN